MIIKRKENGKFVEVIQKFTIKLREWRIQLIMIINFISSKDSDEISTMRTKSNNIEIMMGNEADKITEKLFCKDIEKDQKKK